MRWLPALALVSGQALACVDDGPLVTRLVGKSDAGQWFVSWDMAQDKGVFANSEGATITRSFCIVLGRPMSLATIGTRVQAINRAPDRKTALDAAWAQYVTLPLTDPKLAPVVADMRAAVCPQLLPFTPKVCQ